MDNRSLATEERHKLNVVPSNLGLSIYNEPLISNGEDEIRRPNTIGNYICNRIYMHLYVKGGIRV